MTKKERAHIVPLSHQAIKLLQALPSYKDKATIHGFRGVASTVLNESGLFSVGVIERQLAHIDGNALFIPTPPVF